MNEAQTILAQLGGNRFLAMTGAKNLAHSESERSLSFKLPRAGKGGINYVKIALVGDLYTVTFGKIRGLNYTELAVCEMIFAADLRALFTYRTGLETSLGTMGAR